VDGTINILHPITIIMLSNPDTAATLIIMVMQFGLALQSIVSQGFCPLDFNFHLEERVIL
jgi:hypothetical protein